MSEIEILAQIVDHVAHPVFVKDRRFRFVFVNRALSEMLGVERNDFPGKTDYDFFTKAEADFFREKDVEVFESGEKLEILEEPITDSSGVQHILSTTKAPLRSGGEITHVVGIIHDITELKQVERQLRELNEELERRVEERTSELRQAQEEAIRRERLAVLGQLSGGVAHQLRNPLTAVINAVAILSKEEVGDTTRAALAIIEAESWRANSIVTGLLNYARVRDPERRPESLRELVNEVLQRTERRDTVSVDLRVADLVVPMDAGQISEALGNLVLNAVHAVGERGHVIIEAIEGAEFVVLAVEDDGPGVDMDVAVQLFEPLFTTKSEGFGLGLSTARNLVHGHGGTLTYAATAKGSRFEIRLPLRAD